MPATSEQPGFNAVTSRSSPWGNINLSYRRNRNNSRVSWQRQRAKQCVVKLQPLLGQWSSSSPAPGSGSAAQYRKPPVCKHLRTIAIYQPTRLQQHWRLVRQSGVRFSLASASPLSSLTSWFLTQQYSNSSTSILDHNDNARYDDEPFLEQVSLIERSRKLPTVVNDKHITLYGVDATTPKPSALMIRIWTIPSGSRLQRRAHRIPSRRQSQL